MPNKRACSSAESSEAIVCGERHGPVWYLTATLGRGRTRGGVIAADQVDQVRGWIENDQAVKDRLEKISDIHRELLRRQPQRRRKHLQNP